MVRIPGVMAAARLSGRMLLQVHDELLFEVRAEEADATIKAVKAVMERAAEPACKLATPLVVDAGMGKNWAEAH
jgi:DNA polymerase-1